jgi:hypothetical protein
VLPEAPDIPIEIAHLAGWGGFGPETTDALGMFAQAIAAGDLRTSKLYFDLSAIVNSPLNDAAKQSLVGRIRQIGVRRFLFAVDGADSPARVWQQLTQLPFTPAELNTIASNLAPWMR